MNIKTILAESTNRLSGNEAAFEAQLLLQQALNVNRAWLISHADDALQPSIHAGFEALLQRRLKGEPIAYILGYREFYGLKFKVTPDTLIPRPDTETLVEVALSKIPQGQSTQILDLGAGTGAIALAIAKNCPQAQVTAVDASQAALDVAIENAQSFNISNISFMQSNWFSALHAQQFDVIVSNPPYIEARDGHLEQGDLRFEPVSALASGEDGLDDIKKIIQQAPQHLKPSGWLLLEHGYNQAKQVADLLQQAGFTEIDHVRDLSSIQRVTVGQISGNIE